ncbi:hypothetical protein L7F22_010489 [Adiantum nelumboides]|nr:hypothetical protein [Adiantum nelumboides]
MYSIFRVWLNMRRGLIRHVLSCREEIERQPLVWNDYVRDEHGRQLGERTHIDWARWATGLASSFAMWAESSYVDTAIMAMDSGITRGIAARMVELDAAISDDWQQILTSHRDVPPHVGWWASFDPTGMRFIARYQFLIYRDLWGSDAQWTQCFLLRRLCSGDYGFGRAARCRRLLGIQRSGVGLQSRHLNRHGGASRRPQYGSEEMIPSAAQQVVAPFTGSYFVESTTQPFSMLDLMAPPFEADQDPLGAAVATTLSPGDIFSFAVFCSNISVYCFLTEMNPGPDVLVCDEAHMIKNRKADITQSLKLVRTQRRIALTGSPLQNNLMEYYCMVDFVREGFLGRPQDFKNRFQNPIENGQHADSTEYDVRCMKERTHVLHTQLMGFVQRKGASVVEKELPKKFIYVISVKLSQLQRALYNRFIQLFWTSNEQTLMTLRYHKSLFSTYHALSKVWNHPDLLFTAREDKEVLSDESLDEFLDDEGQSSDEENVEGRKDERRTGSRNQKKSESDGFTVIENCDWCKDLVDMPKGMLEDSGKLVLLLEILSMSSARGEKALVFSQSIPTLNLIESFLEKLPRPKGKGGCWRKHKEWFRLDGQTKARDRQKLVKCFNDPSNSKVQCVLISTKAGSLGINLQAANRVIILDGSWNPTHDMQALFRAWRCA